MPSPRSTETRKPRERIKGASLLDIAIIGGGPANLSLAALLSTAHMRRALKLRWHVFDARNSFDWHGGQLLPRSLMQSEWYRDLVTPIEPTSDFSFLNYLKSRGRIFRFINSGLRLPERSEFNDYMRWVAARIATLHFNHRCMSIAYSTKRKAFGCKFLVREKHNMTVLARNVVVGVGIVPKYPTGVTRDQTSVRHVSNLLNDPSHRIARDVLVVGGGQSGAEAFLYFLEEADLACTKLTWITRDTNFRILDTGNFSREFYSPSFAGLFCTSAKSTRADINTNEKAAGEGISPGTAEQIYQALYRLEYEPGRFRKEAVTVQALKTLKSVKSVGAKLRTVVEDNATGKIGSHARDYIVLCTGFSPAPMDFLADLLGDTAATSLKRAPDYSIDGSRFPKCKLYLQSPSLDSHGLGDPNLVAASGRSAAIINAIARRKVFDVNLADCFLHW